MHLQQRHDAFTPAGPHPQLGMSRGAALYQCIHGLVRVDAMRRAFAIPGVLGIVDPALGFFA